MATETVVETFRAYLRDHNLPITAQRMAIAEGGSAMIRLLRLLIAIVALVIIVWLASGSATILSACCSTP